MVALTNTFEGGTNGTTLTTANTGGTSGTAFDFIVAIADQTLAFDNTRAANGTLSVKLATVLSDGAYGQWTITTLTGSTQYGRLYVYLTANPGSNLDVIQYRNAAVGIGRVRITTAGKLAAIVGATQAAVTTTAVSLNQWVRVEWKFVFDTTGAGVAEVKLFNTATSTTVTETVTATAQTFTSAAVDQTRMGIAVSQPSIGPLWMDDFEVNNTAYPGPSSGSASAQTLVPTTNVTTAGWTTNGAASPYEALDELSASDADYVSSAANPTTSLITVGLGAGVDPLASTGHILSYRIRASGATSSTVKASLYQGVTLIAEETRTSVPAAFTTYTMTLTGAQADAITNYSDLRIHVTATAA